MPPHRSRLPPAAKPTRNVFDPWNASLTGHQRGENRIGQSPGWRASRTRRLQGQFRGGEGEKGKENGGRKGSVMDMLVGQGVKEKETKAEVEWGSTLATNTPMTGSSNSLSVQNPKPEDSLPPTKPTPQIDPPPSKQIFSNLTIHISGSTGPLISDHRLKQLLASHGARIALSPARRTVTHVILGRPNGIGGSGERGGAGGGLAAGKVQQEITRVRGGGGCGVRALESIRNGKRLSEAAYSPMKLAAERQRSVYGIFNVTKKNKAATGPDYKADERVNINYKDNGSVREDVAAGMDQGDEEGKENSQPSLAAL